ncbi:hypothetical protein OESDEN_05358 [Oesophagostomum dentatum]|uniref:Uncharacterized protein n=1 Tax=Oesophagostomum dentatum TaxID=61180 RepID=A0A0B1TFX8_OESDE|nr:hypothetical protein OESDEN_05358 [Oesophagostomum dentatum]
MDSNEKYYRDVLRGNPDARAFEKVGSVVDNVVLLTIDTWYPEFSRRKLHQGAQVVVCTCFLILSILTMNDYRL